MAPHWPCAYPQDASPGEARPAKQHPENQAQSGSSGRQQRDLLIAPAEVACMKPIYSVCSTEAQRAVWNQPMSTERLDLFQTGCLVASAMSLDQVNRRHRAAGFVLIQQSRTRSRTRFQPQRSSEAGPEIAPLGCAEGPWLRGKRVVPRELASELGVARSTAVRVLRRSRRHGSTFEESWGVALLSIGHPKTPRSAGPCTVRVESQVTPACLPRSGELPLVRVSGCCIWREARRIEVLSEPARL